MLALLLGGAGIFAFWRRRRKSAGLGTSPADELRAKLAESRLAEGEPEAEPELESDLEQRRREVHERAKGAIDELS